MNYNSNVSYIWRDTYILDVKMQHLLHVRGQLCHESFVPIVMSHMSNENGPER